MSFKENIYIVEIENSSFCNRKCDYCINKYIDRYTYNNIMPFELYKKIVDQLSDMNYNRIVAFHRYNEPFAFQNDMILERIAYARHNLPNATLVSSTNADYLDEKYLKRIINSGLDELYCQYHTNEYEHMESEEIKRQILKINERIGNYKGKFIINQHSIVYVAIGSGLKHLTIQAKNYMAVGYPRGGIIPNMRTISSKNACYVPLVSFSIDFNGKVTMCINTVSYAKEHERYIIGDCNTMSLTKIYNSDAGKMFRESLINSKRYPVCTDCSCNYKKYAQKIGVI